MRILGLGIAATAVLTLPVAAPAATTYRIAVDKQGFAVRLGPLRANSHPHLRDAVSVFGAASSVRPGRGVCTARWNRLGLKALYTSFGAVEDFCEDGFLQSATLRSRIWRTWAGLRVGMRTSRIRRLHHNATFERGKWVLATQDVFGSEPSPTVTALVRNGRVSAFSLFVGRAGD